MKKAKVSKYGQWKYPGQDTIIPNANGSITMKGVPYPVLGIDDQGNQQMMMPGMDYQFPGNSVYEIPMAKNGGAKKVKIKSLPKAQLRGSTPYAYYNPQLNKWQDPPEDSNATVDWSQYMPAGSLPEITIRPKENPLNTGIYDINSILSNQGSNYVNDQQLQDYNNYLANRNGTRNYFYDTHEAIKDDQGKYTWKPKAGIDYNKLIQGTPLNQFLYKAGSLSSPKDQFGNAHNSFEGLEMGYSPYNIWSSPTTGIGIYDEFSPNNVLSQINFTEDQGEYPVIYFLNAANGSNSNSQDIFSGFSSGDNNLPISLREAVAGKRAMGQGQTYSNLVDSFEKNPTFGKAYKDAFNYNDDLVRLINAPNTTIAGALPLTKDIVAKLKEFEKNSKYSYDAYGNNQMSDEDIKAAIEYEKAVKTYLLEQAGIDSKVGMNSLMHYNYTTPAAYAELNRPGVTNVYQNYDKVFNEFPELQSQGLDWLNDANNKKRFDDFLNTNNIKFYKEGGKLDRYQSTGQVSKERQEKIQKDTERMAYNAAAQTSANWDPQGLNGAAEEMLDYDKKTGKSYRNYYDEPSGQWVRQEVIFEYKPKSYGVPAKNAPKKTKEQIADEQAAKYNKKVEKDPTAFLEANPNYVWVPGIGAVLREGVHPEELKKLDMEKAKEDFVKDLNSDPLQQSLGTASLDNPVTNAAAERYADYTVNNIDPGKTEDQMFRGYKAPTTRDFYQPHNASNTVRGAAGLGATAAGVAGLSAGLIYAPAALDAVYELGAASPYLQALGAGTRQLLSAAPKAAPWLNAGNALTYGFGVKGANAIATGKVAEPWRRANATGRPIDYANAVAENLFTALEIAPFAGPIIKTGVEAAMPALRATGDFFNTVALQTPLRNASKYNPWAFKPDANAAYRMIGNEAGGYADAVHSGVFRPNPTGNYRASFYNVGAPYERYGALQASGTGPQYVAKVPLSNPKLQARFEDDAFRVTRDSHVGIHEPGVQILKENWLRGYKPVRIGSPSNTPKPFYPGATNQSTLAVDISDINLGTTAEAFNEAIATRAATETLALDAPTIDLSRFDLSRPARMYPKKKLPSFDVQPFGDGLKIMHNPRRLKVNTLEEYAAKVKPGDSHGIEYKKVYDPSSSIFDDYISLMLAKDELGQPFFYFSARMPNPFKAGRSFSKLDEFIPSGSYIQEPHSLSLDSWSTMLRRAKSNKFAWEDAGHVPLNQSAVHKAGIFEDYVLPQDMTGSFFTDKYYFGDKTSAQPFLDRLQGLIPKEITGVKPILGSEFYPAAKPTEYQFLQIPNLRLRKLLYGGALKRVKINSLPKAQDGLPTDYESFLKYSETAPENRRPDSEWQYGNPRQYDHYGMWDALGKPESFNQALEKNPQWQPDPYDNMYHGFSTNPNTGVWLKSHIPGESHPGDTGWMEYKDFMLSNDRNWGGKNQNLVYDPDLQRMRYVDRKKAGGTIKQVRIKSLPKAQRGLATAADSSYVARDADAPHDFYKNAGYTILPTNPSTDVRPSGIFEALANRRALMYHDPLRPIGYSEYTNYKPGEHRFEQRELTAGNINKNAPRSKYDDRILPQGIVTYASTLDAFDANGDVAEVPKYDRLAVTPWGKLSKSQKLQRLQKFGTSGTPFAGQSTKKALATFKKPSVPPIPDPKMKEASLLPLPKVELKPQLPTILNPYPPKPETEYFIMPSGNPGVGVIHGRTYDGKGGYKEKVIGPSLARDWFNDADQKAFDTREMSSRIDYDPRDKDPDHKIYADMYSAIQEIDNLRQQEKEARKPKKTPQVKIIKAPKFAIGGSKKKQPGFQILTDANGKYVFVKT